MFDEYLIKNHDIFKDITDVNLTRIISILFDNSTMSRHDLDMVYNNKQSKFYFDDILKELENKNLKEDLLYLLSVIKDISPNYYREYTTKKLLQ